MLNYLLRTAALVCCFSLATLGVQAQQAPPPGFGQATPPPQYDALTLVPLGLTTLGQEASWHTSFTFDRSLLGLASNFAQFDAPTRATIARLNGVAVYLYRFPGPGAYDPAAVDTVRAQYDSLGWKHIVTANKFPDAQAPGQPPGEGAPGPLIPSGPGRTDVWLENHGVNFAGAAILLAGPSSVNLIVVSGDISTLDLLHLRGHFGIPRFPDGALSR